MQPALDANKLATLKKKLLEAKDLTEIADYFLNDLGNDAAFARSGEPIEDQRFLAALGQVVARTVGAKVGMLRGTPVRVAEHRLVHGAFDFGKWTIMMFYFDDVEQGFLALGDERGPDRFARFSLVASPDGKPIKVH